jgi:hypothetical protein
MNDASTGATFSPLGTQAAIFINTLHVVKNGTGRRFYETGVKSDADPMSNVVHYLVRVSDDEGKTWTESEYPLAMFGPADMYADFEIVAIDPTNPDHVYGRVHRSEMVDTLVYSPMQGKDGTWTMLAEVGELDAIEFTPEGVLYYGDDDQMRPGFFVVEKTGDAPKQLSDKWKVGCLTYDSAKKRMFACNDYRFGTADVTTGVFTSQFDMRCAKEFQECPGATKSAHDACEGQLLAAYCGITHYPLAPICAGYDQGPGAPEYIAELDYSCQDGFPVFKPDGAGTSGGSAGSGAAGTGPTGAAAVSGGGGSVAQAGASAAGSSAPAAAGKASVAAGAAAPAPATSGGCGVMPGQSNGAVWAAFGVLAFAFFRRRQRA